MALRVNSASNRNEYQEYFLGSKGGRCGGLTTLPHSCADCLEIWEPQPPGTLGGLSRPVMGLLYVITRMCAKYHALRRYENRVLWGRLRFLRYYLPVGGGDIWRSFEVCLELFAVFQFFFHSLTPPWVIDTGHGIRGL